MATGVHAVRISVCVLLAVLALPHGRARVCICALVDLNFLGGGLLENLGDWVLLSRLVGILGRDAEAA